METSTLELQQDDEVVQDLGLDAFRSNLARLAGTYGGIAELEREVAMAKEGEKSRQRPSPEFEGSARFPQPRTDGSSNTLDMAHGITSARSGENLQTPAASCEAGVALVHGDGAEWSQQYLEAVRHRCEMLSCSLQEEAELELEQLRYLEKAIECGDWIFVIIHGMCFTEISSLNLNPLQEAGLQMLVSTVTDLAPPRTLLPGYLPTAPLLSKLGNTSVHLKEKYEASKRCLENLGKSSKLLKDKWMDQKVPPLTGDLRTSCGISSTHVSEMIQHLSLKDIWTRPFDACYSQVLTLLRKEEMQSALWLKSSPSQPESTSREIARFYRTWMDSYHSIRMEHFRHIKSSSVQPESAGQALSLPTSSTFTSKERAPQIQQNDSSTLALENGRVLSVEEKRHEGSQPTLWANKPLHLALPLPSPQMDLPTMQNRPGFGSQQIPSHVHPTSHFYTQHSHEQHSQHPQLHQYAPLAWRHWTPSHGRVASATQTPIAQHRLDCYEASLPLLPMANSIQSLGVRPQLLPEHENMLRSQPTLPAPYQGNALRQLGADLPILPMTGPTRTIHTPLIQRIDDARYTAPHPNLLNCGLHQAHLRDPTLIVWNSMPTDKHYQFVENFVMRPKLLAPMVVETTWTFEISADEFSLLSHDQESILGAPPLRSVRPGSIMYRLRCVKWKQAEEPSEAQWSEAETDWPSGFCVSLNETPLQLRRKAHHGEDLPVDLNPYIRGGRNHCYVTILRMGPSSESFSIGIERILLQSHTQALDAIKTQAHDMTLRRIAAQLRTSDADVVALDNLLTISLLDPFSRLRIVTAVRSNRCLHLECFDLSNFLATRAGARC